jgi:2,3-bisphosphoglycerate-dependent phosphoglycerate mutase
LAYLPRRLLVAGRYFSPVTDTATDQEPTAFRQQRYEIPPGATDLLLVRHGASEAYLDGTLFPLVDGHGDPPLSAEGKQQAALVCMRLAAAGVDAIYVSNLRRTAETAAPLAGQLGLDLRVEPDLREVYLGEWEGGIFRKMVAEGHPISLRMAAEERWDVIPGAEPAAELERRVRSAIERLAAAHPGQRVAAFTHGGVIGQAIALASASRPFAFLGAENTSISRIVVTTDRWIVRGFNDTAHLD